MATESRFHGDGPVSTTEAAQKVLFVSSSGIRARLTIDDSDFEYSVSTSGKKDSGFSSYSSDSALESDGFVSGEDEFETASDRPFVDDPSTEILQESHFVEEYVGFRPFVKNPNEEIYEESSDVGEFEELLEDNGNAEEYSNNRPFAAHTDEDALGTPVDEDENSSHVELPVVDIGINLLAKQGMPIAQLSWDSDDDFLGNEIVEDESFSGAVRVQSSGVLERFGNAPKVRVCEVEEEEVEDSASQTESVLEAEIVDESIVDGSDDGVVMDSSSEGKYMPLKKIDHDPLLAEVIGDTGPSTTEEAEGAEMNEGIQEFDRNSFVFGSNVRMSDPTNLITEESNHSNTTLINEETDYSYTVEIDSGLVVVEILPSEHIEAELTDVDTVENFVASSLIDGGNCIYRNADVYGTVVLSRSGDSENLVSKIEHNIDQKVKSHDHDAPVPRNVEYFYGATMENEVQSINHAELSEAPVTQRSECFGNDHVAKVTQSLLMEDEAVSNFEPEPTSEIENSSVLMEEEEDLLPYDATESTTFEGSKGLNATEQLMAPDSISHAESSQNHLQAIDTRVVRDPEEEPNAHRNLEGEELSNSSHLATLPWNTTGFGLAESNVTFMSADGTGVFNLEQLAGLGSSVHSLGPTSQLDHPISYAPSELMFNGESKEVLSEQEMKKLEKLQQMRVKFLRLLHRLNQSPEDSIAAKVLYQLLLAAGRPPAEAFSFDFAKMAAMELEAEGKDDLDFSLNILVIGKSGVGKSSTINSIFGEDKATTNAFEPGTTSVKEIKGTLDGVHVRVLDTPGLRSSLMEQSFNNKVLMSIKKITKKFPPDVVLYVDRVDMQTTDLNDLPLLKSVTGFLGSSLWFHTIVTLTHGASTPLEGPSGNTLSYELYVAQRSHVIRQLISHSVGDLNTIKPGLIPVSLVENYSVHEMHQNHQSLLCNQENWRSKLLLLCYSMKILSEIDSVVTPKYDLDHRKYSGFRVLSLPLPYFLSSLLQSNAHPKLSTNEGGKHVDSDTELAYLSDCDQGSDDECDQLPPVKPLRKSQIAKLSKGQRRAYFEEYDYRVKLIQKKQWKEVLGINKNHNEGLKDDVHADEDLDQEKDGSAAVAVPLPEMELPPAFDGDSPAYRHLLLEPSSQLLTRPVLDLYGWDHDCVYDGINIEDNLAIAGRFPAAISVQLTKDKKRFNVHLNTSVSAKHGEKGSTMAELNVQTLGKQLAYTLKTETEMKYLKVNKSSAGISITFLDRNVVAGLKVEDQTAVGKNLILVGGTGLIWCQSDAAYGANIGFRLQEKDYPMEQEQTIFGLSLMRWRGEPVWGLNLQSQFCTGRNSRMDVRAGLNSKRSGQISVRMSGSDNLHIAMMGLLPIAKTIFRSIFTQFSER